MRTTTRTMRRGDRSMRNVISMTRLRCAATVAVLCVALAGCVTPRGLHPTGAKIDPNSLKSERSLAGVPLSPTAWPNKDWWVGYGDPQLSSLIEEALKTNPSLDEAQARAKQAQAAA